MSVVRSARSAPEASIGAEQSAPHKNKSKKHHHHHQHDQWKCADLLDLTKAKRRIFFWEALGSLESLSGQTHYESLLTSPPAVMFHPSHSPAGSERMGDPSRAILLDGRLLSVSNNFPTAMVLSSNILRGRNYGAMRDGSVERGLIIIGGNSSINFSSDDGKFLLPHPSLTSDLVREFAKDAHRDVMAECVTVPTTGDYLVRGDSPLIKIIDRNQQTIRACYPTFTLRGAATAGGMYTIPSGIIVEAHNFFKEAIITRMPHIDMTKLTLRLHRHGADWKAPVIPGADPALNSRLVQAPSSFCVRLELTYRLPVD